MLAASNLRENAMRLRPLLAVPFLLVSCATPQKLGSPARIAEEGPLDALPYTPSLDLTAMDRAADPCGDFYQYVCGGWMKDNPIPADQSAWSVYGKLSNDNERFLWGILQDLAQH